MKDYSSNQPTLPVLGATTYSYNGVTFNLLTASTIPAVLPSNPSAQRGEVEIQNQSSGDILIIMDDGSAAIGGVLAAASLEVLGPGQGTGKQGGGWSSSIVQGRIQIFAPSTTAQVMARTA